MIVDSCCQYEKLLERNIATRSFCVRVCMYAATFIVSKQVPIRGEYIYFRVYAR